MKQFKIIKTYNHTRKHLVETNYKLNAKRFKILEELLTILCEDKERLKFKQEV